MGPNQMSILTGLGPHVPTPFDRRCEGECPATCQRRSKWSRCPIVHAGGTQVPTLGAGSRASSRLAAKINVTDSRPQIRLEEEQRVEATSDYVWNSRW